MDHRARERAADGVYLEAHNNRGNALYALGGLDAALEAYGAALAIDPDFVPAHNGLGTALEASGRIEEALEQYRAALQRDPEYADAHDNLGVALNALDRPQEALAHYEAALRSAPGPPRRTPGVTHVPGQKCYPCAGLHRGRLHLAAR